MALLLVKVSCLVIRPLALVRDGVGGWRKRKKEGGRVDRVPLLLDKPVSRRGTRARIEKPWLRQWPPCPQPSCRRSPAIVWEAVLEAGSKLTKGTQGIQTKAQSKDLLS